MNPEQFLEKVRKIAWDYYDDPENMHAKFDTAMEDLLHELGYGEAVEFICRHERWYA